MNIRSGQINLFLIDYRSLANGRYDTGTAQFFEEHYDYHFVFGFGFMEGENF